MTSPTRVLIVGLDAMDADLARDLAARGSLPVLGSLMEHAASAETVNPIGLLVGGLWPSFATGSTPAQHGFYCFRQLIPGRHEIGRFGPTDIRLPPFWAALSDAGRRCAVIDVPISAVSPMAEGLHVVDWGTHDRMLPFTTWPPDLADEITTRFGPHPIPTKCDDYGERDDHDGLRDALLTAIERKVDLSADLLTRGDWDLFVTVFGESHCAGHQFWRFHDPDHAAYDAAATHGDPVEDVYRALDGALGRLLELVDERTHVVVLLSHGMTRHYDGDHLLAEILRRLDAADGRPPLGVVAREYAMRGLARARRALRPPVRRGVVSTNGARRFFRVPNNEMYGAVRFNLVGREPRGRVQPGAERDRLEEQLRLDLLDLVNDSTGEPVVLDVIRTRDVYDGEAMDALPDLLLEWNKRSPITAVRSPKIGIVRGIYDGPRTGDHRPPGLVLARGPSLQAGSIGRAIAVTDLAPTIAALLDVELPDVEGTPVGDLLASRTAR